MSNFLHAGFPNPQALRCLQFSVIVESRPHHCLAKGASPWRSQRSLLVPRGVTGNLLDYARDPLGFLTECSRNYGDVVRLRFPGLPLYLLNNPDHVEYVLVKNNRNFIKSRYFRRELGFLGQGLLNSEGEFWRRQRRLAQPAFHRQRINAYGEVMVSYTERMLAMWRDGETRDDVIYGLINERRSSGEDTGDLLRCCCMSGTKRATE